MILMNTNMKMLLDNVSMSFDRIPATVTNKKLYAILEGGVYEEGGAFLLRSATSPFTGDEIHYQDLTDKECSVNHIHIDDYLPSDAGAIEHLSESIAYAKQLEEILRSANPDIPFRIILSVELDNLRYCVVRFCRIREDEPPWICLNDLEEFKSEAILVIDV